jgi:membrane-associated protein
MISNLASFIRVAGYLGIFGMVFAESGLLFGVVFPGDTLLFTAGFLASQGYFDITTLIVGSFVCAVVGDSLGYWLGKKFGPKIFDKEDSFFFKRSYVEKTQIFFDKHGRKTIFLARYIPIVRTFAPVFSGLGVMKYRTFLIYNILGGLSWTILMPLLGYFLGTKIPNVDQYILPIVGLIFVISFAPVFFHIFKHKRGTRA